MAFDVVTYNAEKFEMYNDVGFDMVEQNYNPELVNWINIDGIHELDKMTQVNKFFNLPSLLAEDLVNTETLPSAYEYEGQLFFTLKMLRINDNGEIVKEHISLVLGK